MTLRQSCPQCERLLELPDESTGRLAQCPACGVTFSISGSVAGSAGDPQVGEDRFPASPFSAGLDDPIVASEDEAFRAALNPYASPHTQSSRLPTRELELVACSFGEIFSRTIAIFSAQWVPALLSMLMFVSLAAVVCLVAAGAWIAATVTGIDAVGLAVGGVFIAPLLVLVLAYLNVGIARVMLALARGQHNPLAEMFPPLVIVVRFLVGGLVLCVATLPILAVSVVADRAIHAALDPLAGFVAGVLLGSTLSAVLQYFLWAWIPLVSDGQVTSLGSIREALAIAMRNKLTTLLLVLCSFLLSFAGTLTCFVGHLVAYPLTMLLATVGYLMISNQHVTTPPRAG